MKWQYLVYHNYNILITICHNYHSHHTPSNPQQFNINKTLFYHATFDNSFHDYYVD